MGRNVFLGSLLSTASVIVGMPTVAMAQEARQEAGVEDIIVTAQRRSENLQDVPIAITALTATRLNNANIGSTEDLRQVTPGLNIHGLSNVFTPFIRGVGVAFSNPGFDSPIATYVDDVYLTSTVSSTFSLNSIDRIEVLKGPQGTLFGRNATGGVVNVVTKDPSQDREVDFDFGYGNYQTVSTRAYLSGGIAPGVSANVALLYENQNEGWGRNAFDGRDVRKFRNYGGRFKLLFEPGDDTKVRFSGWLNDVHDDRSIYALALGTSGIGGFRRTNGYYDQDSQHGYADRREYGASAKIEHDMGWATITNISAYQNVKLAQPIDSDFTPLPLVNGEIDFKTSAITNELQLASDVTSSLKWIVGLFYLDQKDRDFKVKLSGTNVPGGNVLSADLNTRSFAVFSQATWDLTPTTHLTGGLRYTFDKRRFFNISRTTAAGIQNFASSDASWNKLTYRIALAQDLTDDVMVYASYNRGFNAGGYNLNSPAAPPANPETLDSYELGIKSRVFDRRLQINATAFYMDYQDMHVRSVIPGSLVATAIVNAASARIYGVDLDLEAAVTSRLKLTAAFEESRQKRRPSRRGSAQLLKRFFAASGRSERAGEHRLQRRIVGAACDPLQRRYRLSGAILHHQRAGENRRRDGAVSVCLEYRGSQPLGLAETLHPQGGDGVLQRPVWGGGVIGGEGMRRFRHEAAVKLRGGGMIDQIPSRCCREVGARKRPVTRPPGVQVHLWTEV